MKAVVLYDPPPPPPPNDVVDTGPLGGKQCRQPQLNSSLCTHVRAFTFASPLHTWQELLVPAHLALCALSWCREGKRRVSECGWVYTAAYCEWKRQLKLCIGLQQNIGVPHTVHAHHAHTHTRTHAHTHTHTCTHTDTITELTLPLSNGEHLCIMGTML